MTLEAWLEIHAYLRPVARLAADIDRAAASVDIPDARIPDWERYRQDFVAGVPVVHSAEAGIDLEPVERVASALFDTLESSAAGSALSQLSPGVERFLSWTATRRYLHALVNAFDAWRDEDKWGRRYCPTCGSLPAMAQLIGIDPGRMRLLSCGCCGTRWRFKRTACPFCEKDSQRLASVAIDGEPRLRIDHCEACGGYLKTYNGQGDEGVFLADWTSVHLDLIARERGFKRLAASLYEV